MNWWQRLAKKPQMEARLDAELRFHFERLVADNLQTGMSEEAARRSARLEFGGLEQVREECRDARGAVWLETTLQDIRFAARALRKNPGFAIAAVCTLALGIGANTAIFGVVNAVFLRPLPYADPDRLVWATELFPRFNNRPMLLGPEYGVWREQQTTFKPLSAVGMTIGANLKGMGQPAERVQLGHVTPGFFAMLGVEPQIGRSFAPGEDQAGRDRVAVLSDAVWRTYFHANPRVLGQTVTLDGAPVTVVGVMRSDFIYPDAADAGVWLPDAVGAVPPQPARSMKRVYAIGRLKAGVTIAQAQADLAVIARRMDSQYVGPWARYHAAATVRVAALQQQLAGGSRLALSILMGAVGCILLIVCANVANLFLARSIAREKEIAIRSAIGASRARVVRLLLIESVLLGAVGGLLGIVLLYWGAPALEFLLPAAIPQRIPIDLRVLGFAAGCSLLTAVLFGLAPSLTASKMDVNTGLKEGGAHPSHQRRRVRLRGALAVIQLALSLVLLVGAGLLIRSFLLVLGVNPGFDPRHVLLADVSLAPEELYGPRQQAEFFRRVLDSIKRLPGVEYAAVTSDSPLAPFMSMASGLHAEGEAETDAGVCMSTVSPDFFKTLRIPLLEGRYFNEGDRDGSARVAIFNRTLARILFKDRSAVGRRVQYAKDQWVTVAGVVADIRQSALEEKVWPVMYQPLPQSPAPWMSLVVRAYGDPAGIVPAIRKAVQAIDRDQPLFHIESLEQRVSNSVAQRRERAFLLGSFAFLALFVAVIGVYSAIAYSVTRRRREIGIRLALGAQRIDVLRMVVGQGLRIALTGVAIGLAAALALSRVLASFLFGVTARDLATFVVVSVALTGATLAASYVPARRATRVDPMAALRHE